MSKAIPSTGIQQAAFKEALTEYKAIIGVVRRALEAQLRSSDPNYGGYVELDSIWPDAAVVEINGKYWQYPYILAADGSVTLGQPVQVVEQYVPINSVAANARVEAGMVEAVEILPSPALAKGGAEHPHANPTTGVPTPERGNHHATLIEAVNAAGVATGTVWRVRAIRAGLSLNGVFYPDSVLREAVPLFDGARVFEKADAEHLRGEGKATRNLIGQLRNTVFMEGIAPDTGEVQADLHLLEASGLPVKLTEMWNRGMTDMVGFSIDASGKVRQVAALREATAITRINSLDLIVEPGAGGRLINLLEAAGAADMPTTDDNQNTTPTESLNQGNQSEVQRLKLRLDLAEMREAVNTSGLPDIVQAKLGKVIERGTNLDTLRLVIADEKEVLAKLTEAGHVTGLGGRVEAGPSRAEKVSTQLDDFFDPTKKTTSFRECYVDITGDRGCTGLLQNCDKTRLREALGDDAEFREAISAATFSSVLGSSITRAMLREYANLEAYNDWRWLVDIVPVRDFRTNERTIVGGYGNLPAVAENGAYAALSSPGDNKETYAISKRGGKETISIETIADDDVGLIRRIPVKLGRAAARTVYEFVYDFIRTNPTLGDSIALFHASHGNLGAAALDATSFAAGRLAMKKQAELSSSKKLGIILKHLIVPADLEETAYNLFKQTTNLEKSFVQSRQPMVHVADYWTDANDWAATADKADVPLIELGFFNGNEEPELFVQDMPAHGSLFTNDQIVYKIRHIYGGNVMDYRGLYKAVVA